jgi:cell fate regulator YaaT (PSP1 superfamily)
MSRVHFVRFGLHGHLGRFVSSEAVRHRRGARVLVRSSRGLELGQVLATPEDEPAAEIDGALVRGVTIEDELLAARLERDRVAAVDDCQRRLDAAGIPALLLDAELLFDGRSLVFHFLGDPPPEAVALADELAATYDARARIGDFARTMTEGCGPGCGTEDAAGHGCGSCSTGCAVSAACSVKPRAATPAPVTSTD